MDKSGTRDIERAREANARGAAAIRAGQAQAAVDAFSEAVRMDPTAAALWLNLAHGYRLAGDVTGERKALDRALRIDRTDLSGQLRMAQLLQRYGEHSAAVAAWDLTLGLAEGFNGLPAPVLAEIDAGRRFVAAVRERVNRAVHDALAPVFSSATRESDTVQRRLAAFAGVGTGQRRIYANQCAGLHYPFLPADEFFDASLFPFFAELEAGAGAIRAELDSLLARPCASIRPYVQMDEGLPENMWSGLDGSDEWTACFLWEYGRPNRPVLDACPQTAALLARLPLLDLAGRGPNAFFSFVAAGGHIPPHTGVTNTRAIVHLALDAPAGSEIRVGGDIRPFVEGKAFAFDDTIEHEVWNRTQRQRAVLIMDFWNPHLTPAERDAVARYFAATDASLA